MIVTATGNTVAEVREKLIAIGKEFGLELAPSEPQMSLPLEAPAPKKRGRQPKAATAVAAAPAVRVEDLDEPTEETTDSEPATPPPAPPKASAPKAAPKVTQKDAETALVALNRARGMPEALKLLKKFGVQRLRELPEERFGEFVGECQKMTPNTAA